jgi:hypothetical protein
MAARVSAWWKFTISNNNESELKMNMLALESFAVNHQPFRRMKSLFALLLALSSISFSARGTTVIPPRFDDLVKHAQVIFEGRVTGLQSQWIGEGSEHRIVTFVSFKVGEALKGNPGANYTIRMLGGTIDGQTMQVTDAPKFHVGDHELLFVVNNGSQFIPLVGIQHGRFHIQKDATGADVLTTAAEQPLTDVNQLGADDESTLAKGRRALSLDDFKATVRNRVQTQKTQANVP